MARLLRKTVVRIFGTALVGLAAVAVGYAHYLTFEPDAGAYPVRGIDVSHHQGPIDWAAVAADGVDFAYIKATEGGNFRDTRFAENWTGAGAAGIARGAYHFFTLCRSGTLQAANFTAVVPPTPGMLPPVVDLEYGGNCSARPAPAALRTELADFLAALAAHYGVKPVLYVTRAFHADYLDGELEGYAVWARSLYFAPAYPARPWLLWQFHDRGRRAGISGPVDLNVFRGDRREFERLLTAAPSTAD